MTSRVTRRAEARAAQRPPSRTVTVDITEGDFAGWHAVARADFPASVLARLQSDSIAEVTAAFDTIVLEHNMPDSDGNVAKSMVDVDPYDGMLAVVGAVFDQIATLPNR